MADSLQPGTYEDLVFAPQTNGVYADDKNRRRVDLFATVTFGALVAAVVAGSFLAFSKGESNPYSADFFSNSLSCNWDDYKQAVKEGGGNSPAAAPQDTTGVDSRNFLSTFEKSVGIWLPITAAVAIGMSVGYVLLFRNHAVKMTYATVIVVITMNLAISAVFLALGTNFLILGIVSLIFTLLFAAIMYFWVYRPGHLELCGRLMGVAGKALSEMPALVVASVIIKLVGIVILAYFFTSIIFASFIGQPGKNPMVVRHSSDFQGGRAGTPTEEDLAWGTDVDPDDGEGDTDMPLIGNGDEEVDDPNGRMVDDGDVGVGEEGDDPRSFRRLRRRLLQDAAGGLARCFDAKGNRVNCCVWNTNGLSAIYIFFCSIAIAWTYQVILMMKLYIIGDVVAQWYWCPPGMHGASDARPCIKRATRHALNQGFGSIAFGALVITVIQTIRQIMREQAQDNVVCCIINCIVQPLLALAEVFTRFAVIACAITGKPFIATGRALASVLKRNFLPTMTMWWVPDFVMGGAVFMLSFGWATIVFLCSYFYFKKDHEDVAVLLAYTTCAVCFGFTYFCLNFIASVLLDIVNSIYICWSLDRDQRRPCMRPEILEVYQQVPTMQGSIIEQPDSTLAYGAPVAQARPGQQQEMATYGGTGAAPYSTQYGGSGAPPASAPSYPPYGGPPYAPDAGSTYVNAGYGGFGHAAYGGPQPAQGYPPMNPANTPGYTPPGTYGQGAQNPYGPRF